MTDNFAMYFDLWPHAFEVYALNGMAVFIPNYRGTRTFGDEFHDPANLDVEPAADIISGITTLIDEGIADSTRLAISGHSHGAWLGSLLMTRFKLFRTGSFSEGSLNKIISYGLGSGWINRNVSSAKFGNGVKLYDDLERYADISPALHFKELNAAVLFEAGIRSNAIKMISAINAARNAAMPAEFVVYPRTGHNPTIPRIQRESAERNLDWFRFWLQGYEDREPEKAERYARWRKMRDKRCAREDLDTPSYCHQ